MARAYSTNAGALGKGLAVVDAHLDLEHLAEIFSDDADED